MRACALTFHKTPDPTLSLLAVRKTKDYKPSVCIQCGKCASVCPEGAINQNVNGVYLIDKKKCTGCGKCRNICPMKVIITLDNNKSSKCIACGSCVKACPMDVLQIAKGE